jgi:hypothetical protein
MAKELVRYAVTIFQLKKAQRPVKRAVVLLKNRALHRLALRAWRLGRHRVASAVTGAVHGMLVSAGFASIHIILR